MDFGPDFRYFKLALKGSRPHSGDSMSESKGFRPYSTDFLSDFKDFGDFTPDFKVSKPYLRDVCSDSSNYRNFRDFKDFRSDFRTFLFTEFQK